MKRARFIIVVGLLFISAAFREGGAVENQFNLYFRPVIDVSLDDLDARDALNRPLRNPEKISELAVIFRFSELELGFREADRAWNRISNDLILRSSLYLDSFFDFIENVFEILETAYIRAFRRVVHNVDKLWITFSDDKSGELLPVISLSLENRPSILFMRC